MRKPAGSSGGGVEFGLVAQTKYPGSVTAIQERQLDAAMQFFPPYSHSLGQPMTFACLAWNLRLLPERVVNGEAGEEEHTHTHTHNKLRLYCTDVVLVRVQVTFKQRNSPPHTHNVLYTLALNLLPQSSLRHIHTVTNSHIRPEYLL